MLIDAAHPEETRVAVLERDRLVTIDFDAQNGRQIAGNIYIAKVARVEPALQAAFIDYGGERHGFLPLSEIHPDYFQIPGENRPPPEPDDGNSGGDADPPADPDQTADHERDANGDGNESTVSERSEEDDSADEDEPDEDGETEIRRRARRRPTYAIQEVIRSRRIVLVQIHKEPRGKKGAALTTYLSLAGRYCVFMPNTARGGGVSRKIGSAQDRKRLKAIAQELDVVPGHGVIIRTAGSGRTKAEIKRDYAALLKQWDAIRRKTLDSEAPCLVHEESSLIRRAVRDLYDRETSEILVEGDGAYREAKAYMKVLTPSHAKNVKPYRNAVPIFVQNGIESQLNALFEPQVRLRSGGSIVISPTEALTAIDVNSGRATSERSVEETALRTNLEAADEVARQLRLRDIAGLVVIDFIDMDVERNRRQVEQRLRDGFKSDYARTQLGRISNFGLLEMSRQRLRKSMVEISSEVCAHCAGSGRMRADSSVALAALRRIEESAIENAERVATLRASIPITNFLVNDKRATLTQIEEARDVRIRIQADTDMSHVHYALAWHAPDEEPDLFAEIAPAQEEQRRSRGGRGRRRGRGRGRDVAADSPAGSGEEDSPNGAAAKPNGSGARRGGRARARAEDPGGAPEGSPDRTEPDADAGRRRRGRGRGRRGRAATQDSSAADGGAGPDGTVRGRRGRGRSRADRQAENVQVEAANDNAREPVAAEAAPSPQAIGDPPAVVESREQGSPMPETDAKPSQEETDHADGPPARSRARRRVRAKEPEGESAEAPAPEPTESPAAESAESGGAQPPAAESKSPPRARRRRTAKPATATPDDSAADVDGSKKPARKPRTRRRATESPAAGHGDAADAPAGDSAPPAATVRRRGRRRAAAVPASEPGAGGDGAETPDARTDESAAAA